MLQAVSSYKETVESNLKVGKFIPVILLLRTVLVLELLTLVAICFIQILSFIAVTTEFKMVAVGGIRT